MSEMFNNIDFKVVDSKLLELIRLPKALGQDFQNEDRNKFIKSLSAAFAEACITNY